MASTKEAVPEEAASASDEVEETLPEDVVDSPDFPFVDGLTDLTLRIQNTRLHVSKSILMIASPVFRKMLTSESKEKLQNDFVLENKGETVITLLMKCLYPDQNITYSDEVVDIVLPLVSEYKIQSLVDRCEQFLLQRYFSNQEPSVPTLDRLIEFVNFGAKYGTQELEDSAALALADTPSSRIETHPLFSEIPANDKVKLLTARVKCLEQACSHAYSNCEQSHNYLVRWRNNNYDGYITQSMECLNKSKDILSKCNPSFSK